MGIKYSDHREDLATELTLHDFAQTRKVAHVPKLRTERPHISGLLNDAYSLIQAEMVGIKQRMLREGDISPEDAQRLVRLADALCKLAREEREQEKRTDPGKLNTEELIAQAEAALAALGNED